MKPQLNETKSARAQRAEKRDQDNQFKKVIEESKKQQVEKEHEEFQIQEAIRLSKEEVERQRQEIPVLDNSADSEIDKHI